MDQRDTLSLFSGMGGLDLGAALAGLHVSLATDADETALSCLSEGLGTNTKAGKIEEFDAEELIEASGVPTAGTAYLIGGPPCTAFSHAGFWLDYKRNGKDDQKNRVDDYADCLELLNPKAFVLENVPGLLFKNHRPIFDAFHERAVDLGYQVSFDILNAKDFGVPQARRRVFVVGVKGDKPFELPTGPFADEDSRTAGWTFEDLTDEDNPEEPDEALRGKYADLLPLVPEGDNYLYFTEKRGHPDKLFGWRTKYWSFLLKLDRDQPSSTIPATRITNNGPFHWDNRRLRIREIARLMGFPDSYSIAEDLTDARRHLGNAVAPLVAAEVLWELQLFLGDVNESEKPEALVAALEPSATALAVSEALATPLRAAAEKAEEAAAAA